MVDRQRTLPEIAGNLMVQAIMPAWKKIGREPITTSQAAKLVMAIQSGMLTISGARKIIAEAGRK